MIFSDDIARDRDRSVGAQTETTCQQAVGVGAVRAAGAGRKARKLAMVSEAFALIPVSGINRAEKALPTFLTQVACLLVMWLQVSNQGRPDYFTY